MVEQPTARVDNFGRKQYVATGPVEEDNFALVDIEDHPLPTETARVLPMQPVLLYEGPLDNTIRSFDFVKLILNSPMFVQYTNSQRLKNFHVRVIFRFFTNPHNFGVVVASWVPGALDPFHDPLNADPRLIDISQDSYEFLIPFTALFDYYTPEIAAVANNLSTLRVEPKVDTIASTSDAPRYSIQVAPADLYTFGAVAQMMVTHNRGEHAPVVGVLASAATVTMSALAMSRQLNQIMGGAQEVYHNVNEMVEAAQPVIDPVMDRLRGAFSHREIEYPKVEPLELSTTVNQNPFGPLSEMTTVPFAPLNSRETADELEPYHLAENMVRHKWIDMAQTPTVMNISTTDTQTLNFEPLAFKQYNRYVDCLGKVFSFWRGSMLARFYIYCSPLVTCTFRIRWSLGENANVNTSPQVYTYEYLVRGTTVVDLTLPYVSHLPWMSCGNGFPFAINKVWQVDYQFANIISAGDRASVPVVVTTSCAGEDFQFRRLRTSVSLTATSQCRVMTTKLGGDSSNPGVKVSKRRPGVVEDDYTIEHMCNRWSSRVVNGTVGPDFHNTGFSNIRDYDTLDFLKTLFYFSRGNVKVMLENPTGAPTKFMIEDTVSAVLPTINTRPVANGLAVNDPIFNSVLRFEIPFLSQFEWSANAGLRGIYDSNPAFFKTGLVPTPEVPYNVSFFYYVAAGKGFQLACLAPPYTAAALNVF